MKQDNAPVTDWGLEMKRVNRRDQQNNRLHLGSVLIIGGI